MKELIVGGFYNLKADFEICDFPSLEVISFDNSSMDNLHSLSIADNPMVKTIEINRALTKVSEVVIESMVE